MSATTSILNLGFVWDEKTGNLSSRTDNRVSKTESFGYDKLDRLTGITPSGGSLQTFEYGATGNITMHPQLGVFAYGAAQPHALTNVPKTNYLPTNQTITYNAIGKAATISQTLASGTAGYTISYNPDGERCQTVYSFTGQSNITRYYFDNYEETKVGETYTDYCYIYSPEGLVALYKGGQMYYVFTDHLGSIAAITNASGTITERYSYDAWGRPRNADTWTPLATDNAYEPARITNRGYTGHEHLFTFGLINMNGRMYDPVLGRFLSPDNYVQSPYNSQNYNRYAYCLNNPLKYSDPSGQFVFSLFLGPIGAIIDAACWGAVINGGIYAATIALCDNSWKWSDFGRSLAVGALSGAAGAGAGFLMQGFQVYGAINGALFEGTIQGLAGGVAGGFGNMVMGKDFGSGFLQGFATGFILGGVSGGIKGYENAVSVGANAWTGELYKNKTTYSTGLKEGVTLAPADKDCYAQALEYADKGHGDHPGWQFKRVAGMKDGADAAVVAQNAGIKNEILYNDWDNVIGPKLEDGKEILGVYSSGQGLNHWVNITSITTADKLRVLGGGWERILLSTKIWDPAVGFRSGPTNFINILSLF